MESCKQNYRYIFCCGMYRSASTWQYLVASDLIEKSGLGRRGGFVTINKFLNEESVDEEIVVYKTHDYHPVYGNLIKQGKAKAIYTHRDIRDVICSLMWKFQISFEEALYRHDAFRMAIEGYYQWTSHSEILIQNYDGIILSPLDSIKSITKYLGIVADDELLTSISKDYSKHANQKRTQKIKKELKARGENLELPENALLHDKNSLLHWNHMRPAENYWYEILSNEQIEAMRPFITQWLLDAGYESDVNWRKIEFANRRLAKIFISHSLNFEDVMLWWALKHVDNGCYIDVGVGNLIQASTTKAFYDIGWCGINIEPTKLWFEKLKERRPRDINLNVAVGEVKQEARLYEVVGTGFSTFYKDIAQQVAEPNGYSIVNYSVPVITLNTIFEKCQLEEIHFLKISSQNIEKTVLDGVNFQIHRPWIILVSVTLPNGSVVNFQHWEHQLREKGYHFVYFDGLYRFYVANEQSALDQHFLTPPNYWDQFEHVSVQELRLQKDTLKRELAGERKQKSILQQQLVQERIQRDTLKRELAGEREQKSSLQQQLVQERIQRDTLKRELAGEREQKNIHQSKAHDLAIELQSMRESNFWQITQPLREISSIIKKYLFKNDKLG